MLPEPHSQLPVSPQSPSRAPQASAAAPLRRDCAPVGREGLCGPPPSPPGAARAGRGCGPSLEPIGRGPGGRGRAAAVRAAAATAAHRTERGSAAAGAEAQEPTGPGRDGAAAAPRRTHALSGPKLGPAPPAPPAAPVPAGMMCLECASAAAGGAEEEEADAERRRRRRGAQRGAGGGGCCGARAPGATGVAAADDEVQTLSGSVRRAPAGPPSTPSTPSCAAAAKAPGAQQPKPASLGRGRGAAAAILSLGNVLNYLDRYTVAGELVPHPAREPETPPRGTPGNLWSQAPYIQVLRGVPKGPLLRHNWASDAP